MYSFDDSRRPLVIVDMQGQPSFEDIVCFKADLEDLLERREPYGLIYDLAGVGMPPREVIMDLLKWTRRIKALSRELFEQSVEPIPAYSAYVMTPGLTKLLRFFEQMTPRSDIPQGVFDNYDEALAATERALEGFGVQVPPRAVGSGREQELVERA